MALTLESQHFNQAELSLLRSNLSSLYGDEFEEELNSLFTLVDRFLVNQNLLLGVPEGNEQLQALIANQLVDNNRAKFQEELQAWIKRYRDLDATFSVIGRALHEEQPRGVIRSFEKNSDVSSVWLEDIDIQIALKREIEAPETIKTGGVHILPPVSLVAGAIAAPEEREAPHIFFEKDLTTVLNNNPKAEMTLVRAVNSGQNHWMVATVNIQEGKIIAASLIDSMANAALAASPAYINLQTAINNAQAVGGPRVTVSPQAEGIQVNGYSCGDYSIKKALELKYSKGEEMDPSLQQIRDADVHDPEALRETLLVCIINQHVHLNTEKESLQKVMLEVNAVADGENKAKSLEDKMHALLKTDPALQVKFDRIMAKKLGQLYKRNTGREEVLFVQAREYAFQQLLKKFGLFAPGSEPGHAKPEQTLRGSRKLK